MIENSSMESGERLASPNRWAFLNAFKVKRELTWAELIFASVVAIAGFLFLHDAGYWGAFGYLGNSPCGDAEFWWNGALHFSQGIIAENPNLPYRMGFAIVAGTFVALFGPDFHVFHAFLIIVFLGVTVFLYVSLRASLGRIAAGAAILVLIFNPYTATWLAISSSDGLGMLFNLTALLALIAGVRTTVRWPWLALFGFLFSMASLTRPLMTMFLAPAVLAVIFASWRQWRVMVVALGWMLIAFSLPTLMWMTVMWFSTGNFALTGEAQDSSAFYAASDPTIQTWNPTMYDPIIEAARKRFNTPTPTSKQINSEFWSQTVKNYIRYKRYHVTRLLPHIWCIARYSPDDSTADSIMKHSGGVLLRAGILLCLVFAALSRSNGFGAAAVATLGVIWIIMPFSNGWIILCVATWGLFAICRGNQLLFLWAAYWWTGTAALFLVGGTAGTWTSPVISPLYVDALGARLGFQFFFAGDILTIYTLGCISQLQCRPLVTFLSKWLATFRSLTPSARVSQWAWRMPIGVAAGACLPFLVGGSVIAWRVAERKMATPKAYPDIAEILKDPIGAELTPSSNEVAPNYDLKDGRLFMMQGMCSGFVWNVPNQERCLLLTYQQSWVSPIQMNPKRFDVALCKHVVESEWSGKQGVWIVRSFPGNPLVSNYQAQTEFPTVKAFIPLMRDGLSYDLAHRVIFPVSKSANSMAASGLLTFQGLTPSWNTLQGVQNGMRRFTVLPYDPVAAPPSLHLNVRTAIGKKSGSFYLNVDAASPAARVGLPVTIQITGYAPNGNSTLWEGGITAGGSTLLRVDYAIPDGVTDVIIKLGGTMNSDYLRFYELCVTADDFSR